MKYHNPKQIFCLAPWVHAHVNVNGQRQLCCLPSFGIENTNKTSIPFKDFWNGQKMKEVRLLMLEGKAPSECTSCTSRQYTSDSPRKVLFQEFDNLREEIIEKTAEDGSTSFMPLYYDYRFSNLCNFSCRMCSTHELEIKRSFLPNKLVPAHPLKRAKDNQRIFVPEFKEAIRAGQVKRIYWAGGEPTITPEHWEIMNFAIEVGQAKNISVSYNTNLNTLTYKNQDLLSLVQQFKFYTIHASLDAVGEVGEYIRRGLCWDVFKKNFESFYDADPGRIQLTITLTIPSILYIEGILAFLDKTRICYTPLFCISNNLNDTRDILSPLSAPPEIMQEIAKKFSEQVDKYPDAYFDGFRQAVKHLQGSTSLTNYDQNWKEKFLKARNRYLKEEKKENPKVNLAELYKEKSSAVYAWWMQEL